MNSDLEKLLKERARQQRRPDGTAYLSLPHRDEISIASLTGASLRKVQISALLNDVIPERYCRNQRSLTSAEQILLLRSHVAVIGQGGLGGTVTEILARLGIGSLTLVDGDVFEESNLNRQLLATVDTLGLKKAETGGQRVRAINPAVEVEVVNEFLTKKNGSAILAGAHLAVDCLDSIPSRFILEEACRESDIALVSAAIAGAAGQAMVIFPGETGLRQIYGDPDSTPQKGIETRLGTLPYAAIFMAAVECAEVVSLLCRQNSSLRSSLLIANIDDKTMETISLT
ncbi:HesA/MoeB/ThiF family protein [Desulfopila inferna]|uniref:HesA/MoeB/ThiF family protein n=1 Tax=Desulfopila inferna TaxID=468528 RepID=UPI00196446FB|nr:ThiF family adenylyltransferase [Desulfopila inferna]MBM9603561.1 ThiF family adenylyltransferase [Desulfopila inferna]